MTRVELNDKTILITGAAGFIGAALALKLLRETSGATIVGLDNMNDYYDPKLKESRLAELEIAATTSRSKWRFVRGSIADKEVVDAVFQEYDFPIVVNLAAQAGVRYGLNPSVYRINIVGFFNIRRVRRQCRRKRLSISFTRPRSLRGTKEPLQRQDRVDTGLAVRCDEEIERTPCAFLR